MDEEKIERAIEHFQTATTQFFVADDYEGWLKCEVEAFKGILKFEGAEHFKYLVSYRKNSPLEGRYEQYKNAIGLLWGITRKEQNTDAWKWFIRTKFYAGKELAECLREFLGDIKGELAAEKRDG